MTRAAQAITCALLFVCLPHLAHAQADGSVPPTTADASGVAPASTPANPSDSSTTTPAAAPSAGSASAVPARATTTPASPSEGSGGAAGESSAVPVAQVPTATTSNLAVSADAPTGNAPSTNMVYVIGAAIVALFGVLGLLVVLRGNQKAEGEGKCDSIKAMLEQKKKELEAAIRSWPEEKLKAMVTEAALLEASKDPRAKALIDTVQSARATIASLQKAVDLLSTRFDLCMLSIPVPGSREYEGVLIENSLADSAVLEHVKVTNAYTHGTYDVKDITVSEKQIDMLRESLIEGPWHMRFREKGGDGGYIVFKDARYSIAYTDEASWREAIEHGVALGIPRTALVFSQTL